MNDSESPAPPNPWPLHVRVLAVLHVLSYPLGIIGFAVLTCRAGWLGARHGRWDLEFWSMALSGLCCLAAADRYRRWFENWGRRHYPDGTPPRPKE
jgi:hypothetical protein